MKQIPATITSKGQVTVPVEIRRHLGLERGGSLVFTVTEDGQVVLGVAKYPTAASLAGAAGRLPRPLATDEMLEDAREEALDGRASPGEVYSDDTAYDTFPGVRRRTP